jgi:hypothetical protein
LSSHLIEQPNLFGAIHVAGHECTMKVVAGDEAIESTDAWNARDM